MIAGFKIYLGGSSFQLSKIAIMLAEANKIPIIPGEKPLSGPFDPTSHI
jgi:hypothetical protein